MFYLFDTFNNSLISRHRTLIGAVKAQIRHLRAVRKRNGDNSYLTYGIEDESGPVSEHLIMRAEQEVSL